MALSANQKALLKLYHVEYRMVATGEDSTLDTASAENDVAVAALAAQHAKQGIQPAKYAAIESYLLGLQYTPPV